MSERITDSKSTSPWPGETKSHPRSRCRAGQSGPSLSSIVDGQLLTDESGARHAFDHDDTTGTYLAPEGLNAQYYTTSSGYPGARLGSTHYEFGPAHSTNSFGKYLLTRKHDGAGHSIAYDYWLVQAGEDIYYFDRIRDIAGAVVDYISDATGERFVEPEGRTFRYRLGSYGLVDQTRTDGKVDRFFYGTTSNQLIRVEPADGPALKTGYDSQNRVTTITRVTDPVAAPGRRRRSATSRRPCRATPRTCSSGWLSHRRR